MIAVVAMSGLAFGGDVTIGNVLSSGLRIDNRTGLTCKDLRCDGTNNPYFDSLSIGGSAALSPTSPSYAFNTVLYSGAQLSFATTFTSAASTSSNSSSDAASFLLSNGTIIGKTDTSSEEESTPTRNPVTPEASYLTSMPPVFSLYSTIAMDGPETFTNFASVFPIFVLNTFGLPQTTSTTQEKPTTTTTPASLDLGPTPQATPTDLPTPNAVVTEANVRVAALTESGVVTARAPAASGDISNTPEPSTDILIGAGLIAVGVFSRIKKGN